jgi:predicted amidohydrolase YtcJ
MPTLAILNGNVWRRPEATAVLVDGERIVAVGRERFTADRVIDASGLTILAAFNDAHVHFLAGSRSLSELSLWGAETQGEVERMIREYTGSHAGAWVVGRGWLYSAFPGGMPTVEQLDRLVPDRPAYLESFDAHTAWANSRALEIARLPAKILKEEEMNAVLRHIPAGGQRRDLDALRAGMRLAASRGIGSVQQASEGLEQLDLWKLLRSSGELTMRVRLAFDLTPGADLSRLEGLRQDHDLWISTGILKVFADGVVESHTAAMLEPYARSTERGSLMWDSTELKAAVHEADARGWQVEIHAIGDAAIRQALDAFEGTSPERRHRIEHIETPDPADIMGFAHIGVVASMQPQHADPILTRRWRRNLGRDRADRGWPWRNLRDSGAQLAFGTDWPVVPLDPFASLRMAGQDLTRDEALRAWTWGSAYAEHREREKGEVREGYLADLAVVDLERATVKLTVVGGRVVYEA